MPLGASANVAAGGRKGVSSRSSPTGIATILLPLISAPRSSNLNSMSAARTPRDLAWSLIGDGDWTMRLRAGAEIPGVGDAAIISSFDRGINLGMDILDTNGFGCGAGAGVFFVMGTGLGLLATDRPDFFAFLGGSFFLTIGF